MLHIVKYRQQNCVIMMSADLLKFLLELLCFDNNAKYAITRVNALE